MPGPVQPPKPPPTGLPPGITPDPYNPPPPPPPEGGRNTPARPSNGGRDTPPPPPPPSPVTPVNPPTTNVDLPKPSPMKPVAPIKVPTSPPGPKTPVAKPVVTPVSKPTPQRTDGRDLIYVQPTGNSNVFTVRYADNTAGTLTREQVKARGAEIPIRGNAWIKTGSIAEKLRSTVHDTEESLSREFGTSIKEVQKIIDAFEKNPYKEEFKSISQGGTIPDDLRTRLFEITHIKPDTTREVNAVGEFQSESSKRFTADKVRVNVDNPLAKPEYVTKEAYETLKAKNPNLADTLLHKGIDTFNVQAGYSAEMSKGERDRWIQDNIESDPYLSKVLAENGEDAALKAYDKRQIDIVNIFERNTLPKMPKEYQDAYAKGDMVEMGRLENKYNQEYQSWLDDNIRNDRYLGPILRIEGEQKAINVWAQSQADKLGIWERQNARYQEAKKEIAPYASIDIMQLMRARRPEQIAELLDKQSYDVQKFIYDKPEQSSITTLRNLGMSANVVKNAQQYVDGIQELISNINSNPRTWDDKFSRNSTMLISADELGLIKRGTPGVLMVGDMPHGQIYKGPTIIADFDKFWGSLSKSQQNQLVSSYNANPNKDNDFAALTETVNRAYDKLPSLVQNVIPLIPYVGMPFTAVKGISTIVSKKVTGQSVSGSEYAINAATLALAVLPYLKAPLEGALTKVGSKFVGDYAGKYVGIIGTEGVTRGLSVGAIGVFVKNYADTFGSMSTSEKIIGGGMLSVPFWGTGIRQAQFAKTITRANYVPLRSMSSEASTARVPFTEKQLMEMRKAGVSERDIIQTGDKINEQLASGKKYAEATLGPVKVRIKNVPYQQLVGKSIFQGTPDVTQVGRGGKVPVVREFYAAAKAAIEPMQRSYLTGQRATNPGIIEIRIEDPTLLKKIGPQKRLISSGKTLEPEVVIPSIEQLAGKGYVLEPIPGEAGRGYTFDANLGELQIRRFTLSRITGNETGLMMVKLGNSGNGGVVGLGDLHATNKFAPVFKDINSSFKDPVIEGDPKNPDTWHWKKSSDTGRTVIQLGDSIDRGTQYERWRNTFNRLHDEAQASGDKFIRLLGNHELAYISGDAISGIRYTDSSRLIIKKAILDDIASGKVKAAAAAEGKLFTHAGVSKGLFPEYKKVKSPEVVADDLNTKLRKAVENSTYDHKMFAKGRVEKGHSLLRNERSQGGPFWLRPQEASPEQLDLGFPQVVGHNPGVGVRKIWGPNFIETDVGRRSGGVGVYTDTPFIKSMPVEMLTEPVAGKAPQLSKDISVGLKLRAMRDTVADVFLGWDGRIQSIKNLVNNKTAMEKMLKSLDAQIKQRLASKDTYGARYLERLKEDLTTASAKDYLYGGIGFWRDIVMGRQNSVKVIGNTDKLTASAMAKQVMFVNKMRDQLNRIPDRELTNVFGKSKDDINRLLDTSKLDRSNIPAYQEGIADRLSNYRNIVDEGIERHVLPYLDRERILTDYSRNLQSRYDDIARSPERVYDLRNERGITGERSIRVPLEKAGRAPAGETARVPSSRGERVTTVRPPTVARVPSPPDRTPPPRPPESPVRTPLPPPRTPPPAPPESPSKSIELSEGKKEKETYTPFQVKAAAAFQMGELKVKGKNEPVIIAHFPPYRDVDKRVFVGMDDVPKGMVVHKDSASAYKSIQLLGAVKSPVEINSKQGFARYTIKNPDKQPGKPGAISFGVNGYKPHKKEPVPPASTKPEIKQPTATPFKLKHAGNDGNRTASGLFLSTGTQEFATPKVTGSVTARPLPVLKRNIVPVRRSFATPEVIEVSRFNADTLVRIDKAPVRPMDFANASNVPESLARKIQDYAKSNKGVLYGSLNAYTKMERAPKPHDIDLAFKSRATAQKDIMRLASSEGYKVRTGFPHNVQILKDGKWQEIADIDSLAHHKTLLPKGLSQQVLTRIDGIDTETLGEQYLRQSYGAVSGSKKASQRMEHVKQAAVEVKQMLSLAGAQARGGRSYRSEFNFRDPTKKIASRLSGEGGMMQNVSRKSGKQFKTRVNGGSLISAAPIRGR